MDDRIYGRRAGVVVQLPDCGTAGRSHHAMKAYLATDHVRGVVLESSVQSG
jgi:hypothetical protein